MGVVAPEVRDAPVEEAIVRVCWPLIGRSWSRSERWVARTWCWAHCSGLVWARALRTTSLLLQNLLAAAEERFVFLTAEEFDAGGEDAPEPEPVAAPWEGRLQQQEVLTHLKQGPGSAVTPVPCPKREPKPLGLDPSVVQEAHPRDTSSGNGKAHWHEQGGAARPSGPDCRAFCSGGGRFGQTDNEFEEDEGELPAAESS